MEDFSKVSKEIEGPIIDLISTSTETSPFL